MQWPHRTRCIFYLPLQAKDRNLSPVPVYDSKDWILLSFKVRYHEALD